MHVGQSIGIFQPIVTQMKQCPQSLHVQFSILEPPFGVIGWLVNRYAFVNILKSFIY